MLIFREASSVQHFLQTGLQTWQSVGFVPTMGALHEGHVSLVKAAQQKTQFVACSIFVNPTQFNNKEDFEKYPVSVEKDIELLLQTNCDLLFLPDVAQIYPPQYQPQHYDLGSLEQVLEGKYRPGHFQGVCQVVDRLLQIVQPDALFLGEKDFQQCMVLRRLLQLKPRHKANLIIVPTKREKNGLAMSSRNRRLNKEDRERATTIHQALQHIKNYFGTKNNRQLEAEAKALLSSNGFLIDYVSVADARNLQPANEHTKEAVALIAASLNGIRLIDNMRL